MAARKGQPKKRQRRRRGRLGGLYQLLSVLVVFAAVLVGCVVFFRVNVITVTGNTRYTAAEIIAASGVKEGDNLFLVSRPKTAGSIVNRLPYIESVAPVKKLPDTVELRITETHARCVVETPGGRWLLNQGCKLVDFGDGTLRRDLPLVLGLTPQSPVLGSRMEVDIAQQTRLDGLKSLLAALEKRGLADGVTQFIDFHATNVIYFGYGEGLTVAVPMTGDFDRRALSLQRVLETFAQAEEPLLGTLDLTYGDTQARLLTEQWLPESMRPPAPEPEPEPDLAEEPAETPDGGGRG